MTPRRSPPPHPRKLANQAAKADLLVAEIHKMRRRLGISQAAMLESVAHWPPLWWAQVALQCRKDPPSEDVQNAAIATLAKAALLERMAEVRHG